VNTLPVTLCAVCTSPGHCCRDIPLSVSFWDDEDVHAQWEAVRQSGVALNGWMPFIPLRKDPDRSGYVDDESGRTYSLWRFWCPALSADGLCGVYLNRPHPCRVFQAGIDQPCVMTREDP
jgi:Fe-S-cluster containining protein